jgi:hypothetical protein
VHHLNKISLANVKPCKAVIPDNYKARYAALLSLSTNKVAVRKRANEAKTAFIEDRQSAALATFASAKKLKMPDCSSAAAACNLSSAVDGPGSDDDDDDDDDVVVVETLKNQPSITAALDRMKQGDIRKYNKAQLDLAIADFWHSENLPDRAVDSKRFRRILKLAKTVESDYVPPNRNRIGGDLLDLNFTTCVNQNKALIQKEADVFGVSWLSDGATVGKMPLTNV